MATKVVKWDISVRLLSLDTLLELRIVRVKGKSILRYLWSAVHVKLCLMVQFYRYEMQSIGRFRSFKVSDTWVDVSAAGNLLPSSGTWKKSVQAISRQAQDFRQFEKGALRLNYL